MNEDDFEGADLRAPAATRQPVSLAEMIEPGALIFDLDGTLVDTVEERITAWLRTFEEVGLPADREHVAQLIGADGKRLAREVAAVAGREMDDDRAEAIDRRSGEIYSALNTDPRPLPGVRPLLLALSRGDLPWAIGTSSRAEQVMASVDALGLDKEPTIIDGSHVRHAKPAPDLLLLAAERLGTSPRRCWYIGDATWDMLAARACGMPAVGIASGAVTADALAGAGATAVASFEALGSELRRRGLLPPPG
jgi:HAD superfamily hydrolase (TIGR01509 family)